MTENTSNGGLEIQSTQHVIWIPSQYIKQMYCNYQAVGQWGTSLKKLPSIYRKDSNPDRARVLIDQRCLLLPKQRHTQGIISVSIHSTGTKEFKDGIEKSVPLLARCGPAKKNLWSTNTSSKVMHWVLIMNTCDQHSNQKYPIWLSIISIWTLSENSIWLATRKLDKL